MTRIVAVMDGETEIRALCAASGLELEVLAFQEGQAGVMATDPDGVREFYSLRGLIDRRGSDVVSTDNG